MSIGRSKCFLAAARFGTKTAGGTTTDITDPNDSTYSARLHDPQLCQVTNILDSGEKSSIVTLFDVYNNPADVYEFDYPSGFALGATCPTQTTLNASSFFRRTHTDYKTDAAYVSDAVNLTGLPVTRTVYDGTTQRAQEGWTYDEATVKTISNPLAVTVANHDDTALAARGNWTTHQIWQDQDGTFPAESAVYDTTGAVAFRWDFLSNRTTSCYDDIDTGSQTTPPHVAPTRIIDPRGTTSCSGPAGEANHSNIGTVTYIYDATRLKPTKIIDENGTVTLLEYNDWFNRLTAVKRGSGSQVESWTRYQYSTYPNPNKVETDQDQYGKNDTNPIIAVSLYDRLGRPSESDVYETGGVISTKTTYDGLGRVATTTNPSRGSDGLGFVTTYTWDALGRPLCTTTSDSSWTCAGYAGKVTTTTEKTADGNVVRNVVRTVTRDAAGRITAATDAFGSVAYLYNGLDRLTQVSQGAQSPRTFAFDSRGNLLSTTNPENGTVTYKYDANGNVIYRKDNASRQTCYQYYAVNRPTRWVYYTGTVAAGSSGQCDSVPQGNRTTPTVTLSYDDATKNGLGRLVSVSTADGNVQSIGYDALGRVSSSSETVPGASPYGFGYTYTLADAPKATSYPSGRVVSNTYDSTGRITQISGVPLGGAAVGYLDSALYQPHGAVKSYSYDKVN